MKKIFPVCLFLLATNFLVAQSPLQDSAAVPLRSLKVPITDFLAPFAPAFMLSFEQRIAKRWSVMFEGGLVTSFNGHYFTRKDMSGYKLRSELRYYFNVKNPKTPWYFGAQYMWRTSTIYQEEGLFCNGGCPPNSRVQLIYDYNKIVQAIHFSIGLLVKEKSRLLWDFEVFAGFRRREPRFYGVPNGMKYLGEPNKFFNFRQSETDVLPSLGCAVRIGFRM